MTGSKTATKGKASNIWTAEERAAMKERAKELKAEAERADLEQSVLDKLAEMDKSDRELGEKFHALVKATAPELTSRLWYGMPAYAKDGKLVCFFQDAAKFKARYATIGFTDQAKLDDGNVWPISYAVKALTPADEAKITKLIKQAVS